MRDGIALHLALGIHDRDEGMGAVEPGRDICDGARLGLECRDAILDALVVDLRDGGSVVAPCRPCR
jgi:hypothetical protein